MHNQRIWDVAVIGGGPGGMMAAGRSAERGAKVILVEKNGTLGKKLLITGGGRCNVTNAEFDVRKLLANFKGNDKFLFSPFSQWGVKETLDFFHSKKMETKIEAEKRVFPVSDSATSVWNVLVEYMKEGKVTILFNAPVTGFITKENFIEAVRLKTGEEIKARSFVLATGGKSRPETGSAGDGFTWLKKIGHAVAEPDPALVPIAIKDAWVKKLQGISLSGIKIILWQDGVKQAKGEGKILFTHFGVSGPAILNLSKDIGELLKYGDVTLSLDILPSLDYGKLNSQLLEICQRQSNKKFKNCLSSLMPSALAPIVIKLSGINSDTFSHSVTREERLKLVKLLKNMEMKVAGLLGVEKAIVTSGGVALEEVDFKTMRSRLFANLYFVGDILNIDRPSGGYSLQLCWTTGYVAGTSASA